MKKWWILLFISLPGALCGQTDSSRVLSYNEYMSIVTGQHPLARQADIRVAAGEAGLTRARGAFDPKLMGDFNQKYFQEKEYYRLLDAGLKIPTWFGIELTGGFEQNQGVFLNPENNTPTAGLLYAGISVPIGQDLLIDKRRAELKKARLYLEATEAERQLILNELLLKAGKAYWKWFEAYNKLRVYENAVRLARERYEAVKYGALTGEYPYIDTVEAAIQVQNRLLGYENALLNFRNASANLSVYLWANGQVPLELAPGTTPAIIDSVAALPADSLLLHIKDSLLYNHPSVNKMRLGIEQQQVINRLKRNQILPEIRLKYNPISEYVSPNPTGNFSFNDYTWGLRFRMPLFLRKERGELKLGKLKLQEQQLDLSYKQARIGYQFTAAWNGWHTTKQQADLYAQTVENTRRLLESEQQLFNSGESSLFMINSRETLYIKTQLEYIKLITQNKLAELQTIYALGMLNRALQ